MRKLIFPFYMLAIVAVPLQAHAYIGPGLGAGTIGVVIGLFVSILVAVFAVFWYPIKRILRKKKKPKKTDEADASLNTELDSDKD